MCLLEVISIVYIFSEEYSELCPHGAGILPIITSVQGISQLLTRGTFSSAVLSVELIGYKVLAFFNSVNISILA